MTPLIQGHQPLTERARPQRLTEAVIAGLLPLLLGRRDAALSKMISSLHDLYARSNNP